MAGVPDADTQDVLDAIRDKYVHLIESLNLDFQFTADVINVSDINYVPVIDVVNNANLIAEE